MLIHLEKLGKSFGEKIVLHDVTASVEREDRIGIVGQNGAGKTTLLKILTGEYQDYDGEFSVTHGVTLGYLEQNAKLDATLDLYGEMRSTFAPVLDAMAQMQVLERKMAAQPDDTELLARHDQLQNIVDAADGYNMDVNIKKVLSGMGFAQDTWEKNIAVLSGGELTRLRLAKLLLESPRLLILDEPTNHLDFDTIMWLEDYLQDYKGALLIVSHDRYFLDKLCTSICEIEHTHLRRWKGNYTKFTELKAADTERRIKEYEAQQAEIAKLQDFVDRNIVRATTSAMAKSRVKKLEAMEILEKPITYEKKAKIKFEYDYEPPLDVLSVKNIDICAGDKTLADNISFDVRRGDKIGIVGANGIGKSTLLKIIQKKMPVTHGTIEWNKNIKISYFDQENSQLDFSKTVIDEIHDRRRGMTEQQVRSLLGLVKLTGENVFKKVGVISGGERAKLCFASMMLERGNVLILDEPTNHLDIDAKEVLEQALSDYEGTVILVSHDRYLLSKICGRIFEITPGKLEEFNDGFEQYLTQKRARAEAAQAEIAAAKQENLRRENEEKKAVSYRSKEQRARDAKRRARIKELEKLIGELETQMAAVQQEMVSPEVTGDYVLMNEKCAEFESLKKQSSDYSDEWRELCEEEESLK